MPPGHERGGRTAVLTHTLPSELSTLDGQFAKPIGKDCAREGVPCLTGTDLLLGRRRAVLASRFLGQGAEWHIQGVDESGRLIGKLNLAIQLMPK